MSSPVVNLTSDLIAIPSVSSQSNAQVSDFVQNYLEMNGFTVERVTYEDAFGVQKVNVIAKKGEGTGGLGFFAHSDTVPEGEWPEALTPQIKDGLLIGRGSCDMKGPLAATLLAASAVAAEDLSKPLYVVVAADEEWGHKGALYLTQHSQTLAENWPDFGVIIEPTELIPVYAHKGGSGVKVTAHGVAAHSSTDKGTSANFLIAPFLAEMAELAKVFKSDERYMNHEFDPPTNGFNMVLDDGGTRPNVTAAKTVATISVRAMTNDHHEEALQLIVGAAEKYGLEVQRRSMQPFYIDKNAEVVQAACRATGVESAVTVPYGTEASGYQHHTQPVVLGPGNIAQAHTTGEWVEIAQLEAAVNIYGKMIADLCG